MSDVIPFEPQRATQTRLRVLLADDNPDTVLTLSALLRDEGHEVRALNDGANVTALVRSFDPDVCILDIEMPGKDGYALAHELRDRQFRHRPMLIGISGVWVSPSERVLAIMVGFDHFFQKPADPNELLGVLDDLRQGRKTALNERVHLRRN
jgi:two-component system, OmpR family, response regulator